MIRDQVFRIIREVFVDPNLVIDEKTTAAQVVGWDSFNHMNLIMRIEEEFGITFATDEIGRMGNVGELLKSVAAKSERT